jgi:hypothetical protein
VLNISAKALTTKCVSDKLIILKQGKIPRKSKMTTKTWKNLELTTESCVWVKLNNAPWQVMGVVELNDNYFCLEGCVGAFYFDGTQDCYSYTVGNVYEWILGDKTTSSRNNSPTAKY